MFLFVYIAYESQQNQGSCIAHLRCMLNTKACAEVKWYLNGDKK